MKRKNITVTVFIILFCHAIGSVARADGTSNYNMTRTVISAQYGSSSPTKGESRVNTVTGATLQRITDRSESNTYSSSDMLIVYSRFSPTNSSGEYLLVHAVNSTSSYVYRISDKALVTSLKYDATHDAGEINEIRWDYTGNHPLRVYMVSGMKFIQVDNVLNQAATRTTLHDFSADYPTGSKIFNDVEGDSSADSRYWAWQVAAPYSAGRYPILRIITYDKQTDTILGSILPSSPQTACYGSDNEVLKPNMVEISPNGDRAIIHWGRAWGDSTYGSKNWNCVGLSMDGPHSFPLDFSGNGVKVSVDETHAGWGFDNTGRQLFVSQNNRTDWIEACDILNGSCFNIIQQPTLATDYNLGMHFGKFYNSAKKGWVLLSTYAKATTYWGQEQLIMLELKPSTDSPRTWRITPTYAAYAGDYRQESQAALSVDGNTIWWNNRWGSGAQTIGHQEVFRVELPPTWFADLAGAVQPLPRKAPSMPKILLITN